MSLLVLAFIAGILTVLAPCVLPLLPIIIGGSAANKNPLRPLIIVFSLGVSIVAFTIFIRFALGLLPISLSTWRSLSGVLVVVLGLFYTFPDIWDKINIRLSLSKKFDHVLNKGGQRNDFVGAVLTGVALGPVFSSCSPTYALLLALILPVNLFLGLFYIFVYLAGLMLVLFLIGYWGQVLTSKLRWTTNQNGWFRRGLGILFVLVGIAIIFGLDRQFEIWLVNNLPFSFTQIEQELLNNLI